MQPLSSKTWDNDLRYKSEFRIAHTPYSFDLLDKGGGSVFFSPKFGENFPHEFSVGKIFPRFSMGKIFPHPISEREKISTLYNYFPINAKIIKELLHKS